MWFEVMKTRPREYKRYLGNRPNFYHYITRAFRPASQQTPQYLKRFLGWDEVPDEVKIHIKRLFEKIHPRNKSEVSSVLHKIPGIRVDWDGLEPTIDTTYWNEWRASKGGEQSESQGWGDGNYEQGHLYRTMRALLSRDTSTRHWYM